MYVSSRRQQPEPDIHTNLYLISRRRRYTMHIYMSYHTVCNIIVVFARNKVPQHSMPNKNGNIKHNFTFFAQKMIRTK